MTATVLAAAGGVLILAAVAVLVGVWWAVLCLGAGLLWVAWATWQHEQALDELDRVTE